MKTVIIAIASVISLSAFAVSDNAAVVLERLKSPASVCVMGDPCAENIGKAPLAAASRTGDEVYTAACAGCHTTGAAGAPKTGDVGAWAVRVDQGMETMIKHAINGYNAMPARGLCVDCSDQEIADAVAFMVDKL
jgi:cytochrome c5